jgi:hypothetical protein
MVRGSRKTGLGFGIDFMLITKKRPQGSIYPQITQAPITTYADFLNFFRDGHTIDDNVDAGLLPAPSQPRC